MSGTAGAVAALSMPGVLRSAGAQSLSGKKVVFASWGGSYQDSQKQAFCEPFAKATGASVVQDGPVDYGKLRAMLESGKPTWDVVDVTIDFLYSGAADNLFEKIDTKVVDTKRINPKYVHENGIGDIVWSYNLGYSTTAYNEGNRPRTWADLFDPQKFPGRRMLRDRVSPMLEVALLADGVTPDKLYPLDVERAFKKLDTIKSDIVWWDAGAQPPQLLASHEVVMTTAWNGRIQNAVDQDHKPFAIVWKDQIVEYDMIAIPKGAKNTDLAYKYLAYISQPEIGAQLGRFIPYGPVRADASPFVPADVLPKLPTAPDHMTSYLVADVEFWGDHGEDLVKRFNAWLAQ